MSPILVTGATGTIGRPLVAALTARGLPLRLLARDPERAADLRGPHVTLAQGDFTEPDTLPPALEGVERAFLLTSPSPGQAEVHRSFIQAAEEAGVQHVVKISAYGAAPDAPMQLGRWHAEADDALRSSSLAWTILQPHSFMQNLLAQAEVIRTTGAFYGSSGTGRFAMIDARDIAEAAATILADPAPHAGHSYTLTGPEAVSHDQCADALSHALDREVRYVNLTREAHRAGMVENGLPAWLADDLTTLQAIYANGGGRSVSPAFRSITGRRGRTFPVFARDYAGAFA